MARWSRGKVRISPLASEEADGALGDLDAEARFSQAWLAGRGRRHAGHEAVWHAAYQLPGGWLLRPLRWLPFFHPINRRLYRWVADRRSSACRIDGHDGER